MSGIAALTWHTFLTVWEIPPVVPVLVLGTASLYLWGATRTRRWPQQRTAAFLTGLAVIVLATGSSVNAYSGVLFSMHMAQHLLLIMIAPALLVVGQPLDLARRATTGRLRRLADSAMHSRIFALAYHPIIAFACYAAVVAGTHLTPFLQSALTSPSVHALEEILYLTSGYLLILPAIGDEPIRRPLPHFIRLVLLLISMTVDTIVGIVLLMTPTEPFPAYATIDRRWGPGLVEDLHWGGAAMWIGGDTLMLVLVIIVLARWISSSSSSADLGPWLETARRSALLHDDLSRHSGTSLESSANIDDDEDALRAYNAMLARLAARQHPKRADNHPK
jgi:cytochrome c oxidase assembly factor CtaG